LQTRAKSHGTRYGLLLVGMGVHAHRQKTIRLAGILDLQIEHMLYDVPRAIL